VSITLSGRTCGSIGSDRTKGRDPEPKLGEEERGRRAKKEKENKKEREKKRKRTKRKGKHGQG